MNDEDAAKKKKPPKKKTPPKKPGKNGKPEWVPPWVK